MSTTLHLQIAGSLLLVLSALGLTLPRRFGWRAELERVSLLTRQVFFVHAKFITLIVVFMGILSIGWAHELTTPVPLATPVLAGLMIFWGVRLFMQWGVYDRRLWVGNRFNTTMHYVFTVFWIYLTAVYGWALCGQFGL